MNYDVFISHASEDKDSIARPLAERLESLGVRVWFDECQLTLGDSLRRNIDHGLIQSRFGVVILSPAFFSKEWPLKELDGLVAREDGQGKVILPVWHNINASDITRFSPILASKISISTNRGVNVVANAIAEVISKNGNNSIQKNVKNHEEEYFSKVRSQIFVASSSWELKRLEYELDEHLTRYPHSPDGRLLKDQLHLARVRTEQKEQRQSSPPCYAPSREQQASQPKSIRWLIYLITGLLLLGLLILNLLTF